MRFSLELESRSVGPCSDNEAAKEHVKDIITQAVVIDDKPADTVDDRIASLIHRGQSF